MRLTLLTILVLSSAAANAQASEDRYGPPRPHAMQVATAGGAYQGRMLTWSSRAFTPQTPEMAPPPIARPAAPPQIPAPVARQEAPAPTSPAPRQASAAPLRPAAAPTGPALGPEARPMAEAAPAPARAGLPDSLYSPPPPAPAPQRMAQAAPPATAPTEGSHVRFYSVHRQYGLTPDAIPEPPANASNYVLIGAPNDDARSAPASRDGDADAGDKPF